MKHSRCCCRALMRPCAWVGGNLARLSGPVVAQKHGPSALSQLGLPWRTHGCARMLCEPLARLAEVARQRGGAAPSAGPGFAVVGAVSWAAGSACLARRQFMQRGRSCVCWCTLGVSWAGGCGSAAASKLVMVVVWHGRSASAGRPGLTCGLRTAPASLDSLLTKLTRPVGSPPAVTSGRSASTRGIAGHKPRAAPPQVTAK